MTSRGVKGNGENNRPEWRVLGYGDRVRIEPPPWIEPRSGQLGTVRRTALRGADIWATVEFGDGQRRDYCENELTRVHGEGP